ncbi:MAG: hypothetical protein PHD82_04030 [Candidatus Riflebacteria bacterium]|nr:hypothetical protein [Candidatus Riflebacteria bacterium]
MKKLDLLSSGGKSHQPASGKASFGILCCIPVGLAMIFLAFWLHRFPYKQAYTMAEARAAAILELGAAAAIKPVLNVKNSLTILAKMPVMRNFKTGGLLVPALETRFAALNLLVQSFELPVASVWRLFQEMERSAAYWKEVPDAMLRRFFKVVYFQLTSNENDIEDFNLVARSVSEEDSADIRASAQLVPLTLRFFLNLIDQALLPLRPVAATFDKLPGLRSARQFMAHPVEGLMAIVLDDGVIRTMALKSLDGEIIAAVGDPELITGDSESRDCRAVINGVPFFCGPVFYDQKLKKPMWWVAVPVRDQNRMPVACLAALADVSYLSQLADTMVSGPDRLIFMERGGVAIGHHEAGLVAQQVNLGISLPAASQVGEKPLFSIVRRNYRALMQTAASIRSYGHRHLPDWIVVSQVDLTAGSESENFLILVCVILLAATGVYVLSCCVVRIMKSSREEI